MFEGIDPHEHMPTKAQTKKFMKRVLTSLLQEQPMFTKLQLKNNWEHLSYRTEDGEEVSVTDGPLRVQWPDGTVSTETVVLESYRTTYQDMHHTYTASGDLPVIEFDHHGVKARLRLHELKGVDLSDA